MACATGRLSQGDFCVSRGPLSAPFVDDRRNPMRERDQSFGRRRSVSCQNPSISGEGVTNMSIRHVVKTVAVTGAATLCGAALVLTLGVGSAGASSLTSTDGFTTLTTQGSVAAGTPYSSGQQITVTVSSNSSLSNATLCESQYAALGRPVATPAATTTSRSARTQGASPPVCRPRRAVVSTGQRTSPKPSLSTGTSTTRASSSSSCPTRRTSEHPT